ncbi:MAG TPA: type II toxin-antitoxin system HicB family antitoxin [Longimicrobium sp.]|nr:type II toxin-antitoxin system HicB family antitoxin [Longimicrobium sp.]
MRVTVRGYAAAVSWRDVDHAFLVAIPRLPGCAADGATRDEALWNADVVAAEWIETASALGRPIPSPDPPGSS